MSNNLPQQSYQQQQTVWLQQQAHPNETALYPPNFNTGSSASTSPYVVKDEMRDRDRNVNRTPSPTPSEQRELNTGVFDWKLLTNWRFWIRREWLWYYIALVIILTLTALITIYHKQIVAWLTPVTRWLFNLKFGWLVPIGDLFVISFPPLFGHEIVAILCGLVWGLGVGFGIVAAGTFLGEVGNFYAFKYCCRARGEKLEKSKITYACLAKVVREGGFKIALIARLSAIPGHFTTAVFSTCGMGIIVFSIAAVLSMPKQFITVYLGVILEQTGTGGQTDTKSRIISDVVLAITFLITIGAMWYIFKEMNRVKPQVIYERRKARQVKLNRYSALGAPSESTVTLHANLSDTNIPLTQRRASQQYPFGSQYQRSSQDATTLFAPRPHHVQNQYGYVKDDDGSEESSSTEQGGYGQGYRAARMSTDDVDWNTARRPGMGGDLGRRTMSPESYAQKVPPQSSQLRSPQQQQQPHQYPSPPQQYNSVRYQTQSPPSFNLQASASPVQTPTQASHSYNLHVQPPSASTVNSMGIQAPAYPSQVPLSNPNPSMYLSSSSSQAPPPLNPYGAQPSPGHAPEPTGMSYHTAMGSEDSTFENPYDAYDAGRRRDMNVSEASSIGEYLPGAWGKPGNSSRAQSPPPPSYKTDGR